jgi:pilus assembly protein CpaE
MDTMQHKGHGDRQAEIAPGAQLLPRITIQAFCLHTQTAQMVEMAIHDRRMAKVALTTHNGGIEGAIETYRANPTPNLIVIETAQDTSTLLEDLERLADVCDAATRVIVLGQANDIHLYRELIRFGVSDYLILPATPQSLVDSITELFASEGAAPIGRTIGFISAKGGAGGSTLAHNVSWAISQSTRQNVLVVDMDLPFGTAGLNFNQDPPHGLGDAVSGGEKIDQVMLDRLMAKATAHINLLAAPGTLERTYDFDERAFEQIIELCQRTMPVVVLDIPHAWNAWIQHTLSAIDEIVIVAEPDLANLRNAKNLADTIKMMRPAESEPCLVVNKTGIPRRPEIAATEFAASIECHLLGQIAFDPGIFGTAANNGQMLAEVSASHRANETFSQIGQHVIGRSTGENVGHSGALRLPESLSRLLKIG